MSKKHHYSEALQKIGTRDKKCDTLGICQGRVGGLTESPAHCNWSLGSYLYIRVVHYLSTQFNAEYDSFLFIGAGVSQLSTRITVVQQWWDYFLHSVVRSSITIQIKISMNPNRQWNNKDKEKLWKSFLKPFQCK